jgi:hypothetical protein
MDALAAAERGVKDRTWANAGFALAGGAVEGLLRRAASDAVASAERAASPALALAGGGVETLPFRTDVGHAVAAAERGATRAAALAHPGNALIPLFTLPLAAVEAATTVALVCLQVDAAASAAGLSRTATVAAAATVALVGLEVDAAVSAPSLPFEACGSPSHPWHGGQGGTYQGAAHPPERLASGDGACGKPFSQLVEGGYYAAWIGARVVLCVLVLSLWHLFPSVRSLQPHACV